jgi:phospholipid/cholesterol/gamma-HCH transport system substrate-binding protein
VADNLADLTTSLRDTGGIEQLMDWIYYQVAATNGYDQYGHYLRAGLLLNQCSAYSITFAAACSAKFATTESTQASVRSASAGTNGYVDDPRRSDSLRELDAYMHGLKLDLPGAKQEPASGDAAASASGAAAAGSGSAAGSDAAVSGSAPTGSTPNAPQAALLDYLLGGGE